MSFVEIERSVKLSPGQEEWRVKYLKFMRQQVTTGDEVPREEPTEDEQLKIESVIGSFGRSMFDDVRVRVNQLIKEHEEKCPAESNAYFNRNSMDEVFVLASQIGDPEEQRAAFVKMNEACTAATNRKWNLGIELKKVETATFTNRPQDQVEFNEATTVAAKMLDHIPEDFISQPEKYLKRLETLSSTPDEKKELVRQANIELNEKKEDERQVFQDIIESRGTKELSRLDSFDPVMAYISVDEQNRLTKALNDAMNRAHRIRDCGGTLEEAEKQLEHIPRTWWPAEFVKELQAWRKVERAMRDEAVDKLINDIRQEQEGGSKLDTAATVTGILNKIYGGGSTVSELDVTVPLVGWKIKTFPDNERKLIDGYVTSALTELTTLLEAGGKTVELVETIREKGIEGLKPKDKEELFTKLASFTGKIKEATEAAEKFSPEAKEALEKVIPGMLIAVGLTALAQAIAEHERHRSQRDDSERMIPRAMSDVDDGGALVLALMNEVDARQRQVEGRRVDMIVSGTKVAQGIAELSGPHGTVASKVISIVGTSIEYGGKIYFANVDFNKARSAKETLYRAQGGSTVDRLLVFENSAVYAKMYIAILVKEKNKLAEEFIIKRGYNDSDVAREEVNATILREFLMKSAGQIDERETTDNRFVAMGEALVGVTVKEGKGYLEKARNFRETYFPPGLKCVSPSEYDPKWAHAASDVAADPEIFAATWKRAVEKGGLFDDGTLPPASLTAAMNILNEFGVRDSLTTDGLKSVLRITETNLRSPLRNKERLVAAVKAFRKASSDLRDIQPMHSPCGDKQVVGDHVGMGKYLIALMGLFGGMEALLESRLQGYEDETFSRKADSSWLTVDGVQQPMDSVKDTSWRHSSCELTVENWTSNRSEALGKAWRDDEISADPGVASQIKVVVNASKSSDLTAQKSEPAWRKSRIAWMTALQELIKQLDQYWGECDHEGLRGYIAAVKLKAAADLRKLDAQLYPSLDDFPLNEVNGEQVTVAQKFTAAAWKNAYNTSLGSFDDDIAVGKKLHEAFQAWEKAKQILDKGPAGQELLRARKSVLMALKDIGVFSGTAASEVGTPALMIYLRFIHSHAQELLAETLKAMRATAFNYEQVKSFSTESWNRACSEAVSVGAVPEAKSLASNLGKLLDPARENYKRIVEAYSKSSGGTSKELRKMVDAFIKSIEEIGVAVNALRAADGYMDHPLMNACLNIIQDGADQLRTANMITRILQGAGAEFGKYKFQWDAGHWDNPVKRGAIEAGLLSEDARTGLAAAIRTTDEKSREVLQLLGPKGGRTGTGTVEDRAKELKLLKEFTDSCQTLITLANNQKTQVDNENYRAYMDDCIQNTNEYLAQFRDSVKFQCPSSLVYTDAAWQANKKLAVAAGVLADARTNFGRFVEASAKAHKEFMELKASTSPDQNELRTKRVAARAALGQVVKKANELKAGSKDPELTAYMELWIKEITRRWNDLAA